MISNTTTVILDSDFVIGMYLNTDSNNEKALAIYEKYQHFCITNINLYEIATVLSRLLPQNEAVTIVSNIMNDLSPIAIDFNRDWEVEIISIYNSFTKKNISFVDCTVLFLAQKHNYKIASFDKFYSQELLA
jgi:predicted nucleic acid-binding protein